MAHAAFLRDNHALAPMHPLSRPSLRWSVDGILLCSFFISGCSALIYQTGWQRMLYGVIGVDMDSITIIVSVFMLGIGIGGMLGGWLADRHPWQRLRWYAAAELSIAVYGIASLWLIELLGAGLTTIAWEHAAVSALACVAFLMLPTVLMGMTLPLLTMAFNEQQLSIGVSVGLLYFVNTLGAAVGAGLVPFLLLPMWSLDQVVGCAVAGNLLVVLCATFSLRCPRAQSEFAA